MKLYVHPFSSNARKARIVAKQLAVAVEEIPVALERGEQRNPDFLALNPNGAVPVLEHDGFVLPESHAIMTYLCDQAGEAGASLYPTSLVARATVNRWLFWASNHWSPSIAGLNFENNLKKLFGLGEADPAQIARHERFFNQFAAVLDAHLRDRDWVAGDGRGAISLADFSIAAPLMYIHAAKLPVGAYPNLQRWFASVQEIPAWKATEPPAFGAS